MSEKGEGQERAGQKMTGQREGCQERAVRGGQVGG